MKGKWALGVVGVAVMALGSGCVSLDKHQALERSHRLLQEKLAETQDDLQNAELQLQQKDTQIAALNDQLATKNAMISSLQAETESLRDGLARAQAILEKMSTRGGRESIIINTSPLPPDVNAAIKGLVDQYPDLLSYDEKTGAVRWKADLLFPLGSDDMTTSPEVMEALEKFVQILGMPSAANLDVIVVGHTCTTPIRRAETLANFKDNWYLSAGRAIKVMQLIASKGVEMTRLGVMGYGEYRPIADNGSAEGKAKNRRVEVYLVPRNAVQSVAGQASVYEVKDSNLTFARSAPPAAEEAAPAN
jgi:chemotaxis protein MotB